MGGQIPGFRSQVLARVRQRYLERVDYALHVLQFVRAWAARADEVRIRVVIGRIRMIRREQLEWLERRFWPLRLDDAECRFQGDEF